MNVRVIPMNRSQRNGEVTVFATVTLVLTFVPLGAAQAQQKPTSVPPDHAAKMAEGLALFKQRVRPAVDRPVPGMSWREGEEGRL